MVLARLHTDSGATRLSWLAAVARGDVLDDHDRRRLPGRGPLGGFRSQVNRALAHPETRSATFHPNEFITGASGELVPHSQRLSSTLRAEQLEGGSELLFGIEQVHLPRFSQTANIPSWLRRPGGYEITFKVWTSRARKETLSGTSHRLGARQAIASASRAIAGGWGWISGATVPEEEVAEESELGPLDTLIRDDTWLDAGLIRVEEHLAQGLEESEHHADEHGHWPWPRGQNSRARGPGGALDFGCRAALYRAGAAHAADTPTVVDTSHRAASADWEDANGELPVILLVGSGCEGAQLRLDGHIMTASADDELPGGPSGLVGPGLYRVQDWPEMAELFNHPRASTLTVRAWPRPLLEVGVSLPEDGDLQRARLPIPNPEHDRSLVVVAVAHFEGEERWIGWKVLDTQSFFGSPKVLFSRSLGHFIDSVRRGASEQLRWNRIPADIDSTGVAPAEPEEVMVEFQVQDTAEYMRSGLQPHVTLPAAVSGTCRIGTSSTLELALTPAEGSPAALFEASAGAEASRHAKQQASNLYPPMESQHLSDFLALPEAEREAFDPRISEREILVDGEAVQLPGQGTVRWKHCFPASTVGNQGSCGSCWAFAGLGVMSDKQCLHDPKSVLSSNGERLNRFSTQQILSCSRREGCMGGNNRMVIEHMAYRGAALEADYGPFEVGCWQDSGGGVVEPADPNSPQCFRYANAPEAQKPCPCRETQPTVQPECKADIEHSYGVSPAGLSGYPGITGYGIRLSPGDLNQFKAELYMAGPFFVGFKVYSSFFSFFHQNPMGIYSEAEGDERGGHAATLTGWGTSADVEYWLLRNSWGPHWADGGYFRMKAGIDLCNLESRSITLAFPDEHAMLPEWAAIDEENRRHTEEEQLRRSIEARRRRDEMAVAASPELQLTTSRLTTDFSSYDSSGYGLTLSAECNRPCEAAGASQLHETLSIISSRRVDDTSFEVNFHVATASIAPGGEEIEVTVVAQTAARVGSDENVDVLVGASGPTLGSGTASVFLPKASPLSVFSWLEARTTEAHGDTAGDYVFVNCSRPCQPRWTGSWWAWAQMASSDNNFEEPRDEPPRSSISGASAFKIDAPEYQNRGHYRLAFEIEDSGMLLTTEVRYESKWLEPGPIGRDLDGHTVRDTIR